MPYCSRVSQVYIETRRVVPNLAIVVGTQPRKKLMEYLQNPHLPEPITPINPATHTFSKLKLMITSSPADLCTYICQLST